MDIKDSNGVVFSEITPKDGVLITSVVYGETPPFTAVGEEKCQLVGSYTTGNEVVLYLEINDNGVEKFKYFEKVGETWNEVDEKGFDDKFIPLMGGSVTYGTLDLASPDESKVDILRASRNEVEKKEYYPKDTSKITTVMDGNKELWKKDEDYQKFLSATLSSKGKS
ncbi:hypothetical protein BEWA_001800 [Theileria equi strain WA]|uniref:Uncharacterized protein n=1 Tax=Theileria equi strain WA TaxID=1537102 RepID=L0AZT5_THEEQ|nr:hypothetical protein BEWA_001800 [Theileria equi strain WA]AFZ80773.1 hypothetical protein BEWA_001800 [Theileria equi strain WA]|eukprot:XP_004830439.1 hypothetical protein BEWA_001800 [Theileria equi strain WA]